MSRLATSIDFNSSVSAMTIGTRQEQKLARYWARLCTPYLATARTFPIGSLQCLTSFSTTTPGTPYRRKADDKNPNSHQPFSKTRSYEFADSFAKERSLRR